MFIYTKMDNSIIIPTNISRLAVNYSIPLLLFLSIVSTIYGQFLMTVLNFILYKTSSFHWNRIYRNGIMRYIDMAVAMTNLVYGTYMINVYYPNMKYFWYRNTLISVIVFSINDTFFFIMNSRWKNKTPLYYQSVITDMIFYTIYQ
jgi:hypothetical protein